MEKTLQILITFIMMFIIGGISAYFAEKRGRNPYTWFLLGMFFGLLSLLVLFLLPSLVKEASLTKSSSSHIVEFPHPTSLTKLEEQEWFFLDKDHTQQGPVSFRILVKKWQEAELDEEAYLWTEGMRDWQKIRNMPAVIDLLEQK